MPLQPVAEPVAAPRRRPGEQQRQALEATAEGREMLAQARRELGHALAADGLVGLAALRLKTGRTQEQLAQALGISQPALSKLESAAQDIRADTLGRLAQALGVPAADVLQAHQDTRAARQAASETKERRR